MCLNGFIGACNCKNKQCLPVIEPQKLLNSQKVSSCNEVSKSEPRSDNTLNYLNVDIFGDTCLDINHKINYLKHNPSVNTIIFCPIEEIIQNFFDVKDVYEIHHESYSSPTIYLKNSKQIYQNNSMKSMNPDVHSYTSLNCLLYDMNKEKNCHSVTNLSSYLSNYSNTKLLNQQLNTNLDLSTLFLLNDEQLSTSTTIDLGWSQYELENFSQINPDYTYQSIINYKLNNLNSLTNITENFEQQLGCCTSTTHELRWTQIEQESINSLETATNNLTNLSFVNNKIKNRLIQSIDNYISSQMETNNLPVQTNSDVSSILFEHSVPIKSNNLTPDSNDISYYFYSHYENPKLQSSLNNTTSDYTIPTSLAVHHYSSLYCPLETPVSHHYSIKSMGTYESPSIQTHFYGDVLDLCPKYMNDNVSKYVTYEYKLSIEHKSDDLTDLIIIQTNLINGPPIINLCRKSTRILNETLDNLDFDYNKEVNIDFNVYVPSTAKRLTVLSNHVKNLNQVRGLKALKQSMSFLPFEKLYTPLSINSQKSSNSCLIKQLMKLDLNDYDIRELELESDMHIEPYMLLRCTYVEVSLNRNLQSFDLPKTLNHTDAKTVFTLLERQLRNAVATYALVKNFKEEYISPVTSTSCFSLSCGIRSNQNRPKIRDFGDMKIYPNNKKLSGSPFLGYVYQQPPHALSLQHNLFNGAYIFNSGPEHVKPPKPWWDHIKKVKTNCECRCITAWKLKQYDLTIGGLINYDNHLQLIISSNDGRLGIAYTQALSLLNEMTQRGLRYVCDKNIKCLSNENINCNYSTPQIKHSDNFYNDMTIRIYFQSLEIGKLLQCDYDDMSAVLGLQVYGLGIKMLNKIHPNHKTNVFLLYTKYDITSNQIDCLKQILVGIKQLRLINLELIKFYDQFNLDFITPVETLSYLIKRMQTINSNSLIYIKKYLTTNLINEYKNKTTYYHGTFAHCLRINAYNPSTICPIATDPDTYNIFMKFFDPVIMDVNNLNKLYHLNQASYSKLNERNPHKSELKQIESYHLKISRNISGYSFNCLLNLEELYMIENLCKTVLLSWNQYGLGMCYSLQDFNDKHPTLYANLLKKNLFVHLNDPFKQILGIFRYWPKGRSIYIAPKIHTDIDLIVQINCEDHLNIIGVDWSGKLPYTLSNYVMKLLEWLDMNLKFSFSPKLGYLNSKPWNLGCAMKLSALTKFINLDKNISTLEKLCAQYDLKYNLYYTNYETPFLSHKVKISTFNTIGRTESQVLQAFVKSLVQICKIDLKCKTSNKLPNIHATN